MDTRGSQPFRVLSISVVYKLDFNNLFINSPYCKRFITKVKRVSLWHYFLLLEAYVMIRKEKSKRYITSPPPPPLLPHPNLTQLSAFFGVKK